MAQKPSKGMPEKLALLQATLFVAMFAQDEGLDALAIYPPGVVSARI